MSRALAFQLLCGCLTLDMPPTRRAEMQRMAHSGLINWETFLELANHTLVAPALLRMARDNGISDIFPSAVADFLDGMSELNRQRNTRIQSEALELGAILNHRGVVPVLLKGGAHLLSGLHKDPAARIMVDLDMLVSGAQLLDCASAMREHGYQVIWDNGYPASHHFPPLGRPGATVPVELHERPVPDPHTNILEADQVLATMSRLFFGNVTLAVPSVQARVIHTIIHAQLAGHDYLYGQFSLRDLMDYARLCELHGNQIDWVDIRERFTKYGAATALSYQVLAAREFLGVPIAPEIRVGLIAKFLFRTAAWQVSHPKVLDLRIQLLRPLLLLQRSLSSRLLRQKLLRDLRDTGWLKRHWRLLWSADPHKP